MEEDFVVVRLPKEDYEVLKELIKEREAYNYLTYKIKSLWIWAVVSGIISLVSGIISLFIFWDYVKELFVKV